MAKKTYSVSCLLTSGLHLRIFRNRNNEMGEKGFVNDHNVDDVILSQGINEKVDGEFFEAWLEQNKDTAPVTQGLIQYFKDPEPEEETRAEETPAEDTVVTDPPAEPLTEEIHTDGESERRDETEGSTSEDHEEGGQGSGS